ncbi:dynein regulatory complex subunit 5-like [Nelusetta ayraudi]|uniref:dynein regulatory complex subunit 5-like n=1 Tax=Nelusetta ayraudi TaxID=303726 RepID=UPI003F720063
MRRFFAEDPNWTLDTVTPLSDLCLQSIIEHFAEKPIFKELSPTQKDYVQQRLSTSLPLHVTAGLVDDGTYWERCCRERWDLCDVSEYEHSWRRMYLERHVESAIELYIPQVTDAKDVLDLVPLCKNYIKRLDIAQLLTPVKENQEEEEEQDKLSLVLETHSDKPCVDRFNFNTMLHHLTCLEELHLMYRVKQCGMNFEWPMFEMTDTDCENLGKAVKSCRTLKVLQIHLSKVEDNKCRTLVRYLLDHPSLKVLDLSHNQIGDRGARALGKLLGSSKLETLTLYDNSIGDPGAKAIGHALSKNPRLWSLNLALNRVQDDGGEALVSGLMKNSLLLHLNLAANELTTRTAVALHEALLCNNSLKAINLSGNNLGVDGVKALEEMLHHNTSITELDIRLTEAREKSASVIAQALLANQRGLEPKKSTTEDSEVKDAVNKAS